MVKLEYKTEEGYGIEIRITAKKKTSTDECTHKAVIEAIMPDEDKKLTKKQSEGLQLAMALGIAQTFELRFNPRFDVEFVNFEIHQHGVKQTKEDTLMGNMFFGGPMGQA